MGQPSISATEPRSVAASFSHLQETGPFLVELLLVLFLKFLCIEHDTTSFVCSNLLAVRSLDCWQSSDRCQQVRMCCFSPNYLSLCPGHSFGWENSGGGRVAGRCGRRRR